MRGRTLVAVAARRGKQLLAERPSVVDRMPVLPWVVDRMLEPLGVQVGFVLPLERLLRNIVGKGRDPCMFLNHRDKSTFHIGCRRILLGGWGDNSIVPVRARGWVRQG